MGFEPRHNINRARRWPVELAKVILVKRYVEVVDVHCSCVSIFKPLNVRTDVVLEWLKSQLALPGAPPCRLASRPAPDTLGLIVTLYADMVYFQIEATTT